VFLPLILCLGIDTIDIGRSEPADVAHQSYGIGEIMNHEDIVALIKNAPDAGAASGAWWASTLRKPEFENGGTDPANMFTKVMARMMSDDNPQNEGALEVFAGKLAKNVNEALKHESDYGVTLSVDYHPDMMLSDAAVEANLSINEFGWPWKTCMRITRNHVTVSAGYQADWETIWGVSDKASA
jgi:hypothetical protein